MKDASDIVAEVYGKVVDDELARRLKNLILEHVEAVALAGIRAANEECAKLADDMAADHVADAIRERGLS